MSDEQTRYARVTANYPDRAYAERTVAAYLPENYRLWASYELSDTADDGIFVLITGEDSSGWTMDDYVLPRLASGGHFGTELTEGEWSDERAHVFANAGAEVELPLRKLYVLCDGDAGAVGDMLYDIDKVAQRNARHEMEER